MVHAGGVAAVRRPSEAFWPRDDRDDPLPTVPPPPQPALTDRTPLLHRNGSAAGGSTRRFSMGTFNQGDVPKTTIGGALGGQPTLGNYWHSLDKYTSYEFTSSRRKSSRFSKRRQKTVALETSTSLLCEEKCNGGVHFETVASDSEQKPLNSPNHRVVRRRQSGYGIAITSESTAKMRCRQRKQLFVKRNKICDLSLLLAVVGLFLAIIDAEVTAQGETAEIKEAKNGWFSLLLRSMGVLSTLALLLTLINYHAIEVKIALIDSGADDWRVALTTDRIIKLTIEVMVCAVCPFPGTGFMVWPFLSAEDRKPEPVEVPVDVVLSVPMFLRSYLLCRFMVLHSKQFQDAATRSIAALNRISMDFRFVIKTMMADHPLRVLIVFTVSYWVCMSWMFTQCERYEGKVSADHYYLNSMWFIMVTFMSIGYGDIVPNTYCGRTLSITTGIVGAGVSSALIAVISRKLELSRAEKHVNNFMADSKLTNQRKNAAASVLQQTWFIHKYQRPNSKGDDLRLRHHQRKFLSSINEFRRIKWDQRKLQEKGNSLLDVGKLHSEMHETLWEMHRTQDQFINQVATLSQRITELQNTILLGIQANGGTLPAMAPVANGHANGGTLPAMAPVANGHAIPSLSTSTTLGIPPNAPSFQQRLCMAPSRPPSGASQRSQLIAATVSNPNLCGTPVPQPLPPPLLQRFQSQASEQSTPEVVVDVCSPLLHQHSSEH
uniref:CaMBD domain-containing protein n=1 Tax=Steinernema glaseri TaxID=37863 RepID=A0A1I7ZS15_9BILA